MKYFHEPVLVNEVMELLALEPGQNVVDGTVGGGGHAQAMLAKTSPDGKLLGLDKDPRAIKAAGERLKVFGSRVKLIQESYKNTNQIIYEQRPNILYHRVLLDLGISSAQLSSEEGRGFSFQFSQRLDMRFGAEGQTAQEILNYFSPEALEKIFKEFGEERYAKAIARAIVNYRQAKTLETSDELANIIEDLYRGKRGKIHPATKVFQALRIYVNHELEELSQGLPKILEILPKGGRLAVISYHSLEDRIVKQYFKYESVDCHCPTEFPVCRCGHKAILKLITKKAFQPREEEIKNNSRSRSAKLRVIEKL